MVKTSEDPAAMNGSRFARRDRLVMENLALVRAIALRIHDHLPACVDLDDLIHEGQLGLLDAAERFDPGKNLSFSVYARHRIRGAILDSLRESDWATRTQRQQQRRVRQATHELQAALHRSPTEDELADKTGIEVSRLRRVALDLRDACLLSGSNRAVDNDELPAPEFLAKPDSRPDSICARREIREELGAAMGKLSERHRLVLSLYYHHEMSMKEIGDTLGVNESRVSQIHRTALTAMATALHIKGITSSRAF